MPRNKLSDLNDHLFMELERLNDESLTGADLETEIKRGKAIASLATNIVNSGELVIKAARFQEERLDASKCLPETLA